MYGRTEASESSFSGCNRSDSIVCNKLAGRASEPTWNATSSAPNSRQTQDIKPRFMCLNGEYARWRIALLHRVLIVLRHSVL